MENKMKNNSIEYVLAGDYYIPDLKLPNEERTIGKYGRMHRDYLKEHNSMRFNVSYDGKNNMLIIKRFDIFADNVIYYTVD